MWISCKAAGVTVCCLVNLYTTGTHPAFSPVKPGLDFRDRPNRKRFSPENKSIFPVLAFTCRQSSAQIAVCFSEYPNVRYKFIFWKINFQYLGIEVQSGRVFWIWLDGCKQPLDRHAFKKACMHTGCRWNCNPWQALINKSERITQPMAIYGGTAGLFSVHLSYFCLMQHCTT